MTRQIERWSKQYQASEMQRIDAMHELMAWLPANTPQSDEVSIVHGDYRLDNLVFAKDSAKVIGVLDWELSTLGNPIADFAYHCMAWHIPQGVFRGLAGSDFAALNIPTEQAYVQRYCERTGRDAQSFGRDWSFYLAYNLFRAAAILVGVAKRASQGNAASADGAAVGKQAVPLSQLALKIATGR
jgi:aminoglycoside phosphotransferase (APT) family kinase protein